MIAPDWEEALIRYIIGKADSIEIIVHAIGGMEDHVHVVVSVPPKHAIADVVSQLKGSSSHWVNDRIKSDIPFAWQRGYGVFSLGSRQLEHAVDYVRRQKEHHRGGSAIRWLERVGDEDDPTGPFQPEN